MFLVRMFPKQDYVDGLVHASRCCDPRNCASPVCFNPEETVLPWCTMWYPCPQPAGLVALCVSSCGNLCSATQEIATTTWTVRFPDAGKTTPHSAISLF